MDNLFLNRMITPVEDAAGGEADKPAKGGQDSRQGIVEKDVYGKAVSAVF
jgi:hypothetical protein